MTIPFALRLHGARRPALALLAAASALTLLSSLPASAFSVYGNVFDGSGALDVQATLQNTARWSPEPLDGAGLHDGIQVGVEPGFAENLGASTPEEVALVEAAVVAGFQAWENPVLSFDVTFDASVEDGPGGFEIDLFAVDGGSGYGVAFGWAGFGAEFVPNRLLTNGQRYDGHVITDADMFLNYTNVAWFLAQNPGLTEEEKLAALQRLVMHEAGHTLGLSHPTVDPYQFDTDLDPLNEMEIDPSDPFSALIVSPNVDWDAIMSGLNYGSSVEALFFTELRPDDRGGRDALYPVPEPTTLLLLGLGCAALAVARQRS